MPNGSPILTPDSGKAHSAALVVLCALALLQAGAVGRALWLAKSKSTAVASANLGTFSKLPEPPLPPGAIPPAQTNSFMPPPAVPQPGSTPARFVPATKPATPAAVSQPAPGKSAAEAEVAELLQLARDLRPLGDLQGLIAVLKKAEMLTPDNPVVLGEMARTYDEMGLKDRALVVWKNIEALGPMRGGEFYQKAIQRLGGGAVTPSNADGGSILSSGSGLTTPDARPLDPAKTLALGAAQVIRDPTVTTGEKLVLRLPIRARAGQLGNPQDVDIQVFFFDEVNGERVEQTKADSPATAWVSEPIDWQGGTEMLDVTYFMPLMSLDEIKTNGRRKFHGYIVKLYYQNKLQDTLAAPESLLGFGAQNAAPPSGNPLLPPVTR